MNGKNLAELADSLFAKKAPLNSLRQEIAENFYPERAEFTVKQSLGDDYASELMTSYPIISRRSLGDQFSTMLRPTAREWFHVTRRHHDVKKETDTEVRQYLEWFGTVMRRAMYDPNALFSRASKMGDHDVAAFGECCKSVEMNSRGDGLLYRCWHLNAMAWQENESGKLGFVARRWTPTVYMACQYFSGRLNEKLVKRKEKDPFSDVELLHIVCDAQMYNDQNHGRPRWSIWWDRENNELIEAVPIWGRYYIIPRWAYSQSQYAYSPAVMAALPDARLLQAMAFTMLEVSEKAAQPPVLATKNVIKSDMALYAGGITWVDAEYDERLGRALQPLNQDFRGVNYGLEMIQDTRSIMYQAFYLDTLTMPRGGPAQTAYEVGQRIQEYIRNALPLFEPMEHEDNAAMCGETFELMMRNGAFGSPQDWPKAIRQSAIDFQFESPLHDVIEQQKAQKWTEARALVSDVAAIDPTAVEVIDSVTALRDSLEAAGVPAKWIRSRDDAAERIDQQKQQQEAAQVLAALEQGSKTAANFGKAERDSSMAGVI